MSKKPLVAVPNGPAPAHLVTKDLIKGTGAVAKSGGSVAVNYVGVLYKNGQEFDSSWKRSQTFPFQLGQGQVIKGWDQGVPGMKVGGRRELIIPASLAYGAQGSPPTIPPNAPLVFVVDLLAAK
ncbi:MAG: FKBP-type peptidyl-prolyl cis-trans isomerase [Actinomycetota bacterium]|nr:FKBP-type peptidyl-prolyl cis-trans isomerase [Actinomycetota bacterium]